MIKREQGGFYMKNITTENTIAEARYSVVENSLINKTLIFHLDRGSQYASTTFRNILKNL